MVWNFFIVPHIRYNHPNWLIFSEGLKPPSRLWLLLYYYHCYYWFYYHYYQSYCYYDCPYISSIQVLDVIFLLSLLRPFFRKGGICGIILIKSEKVLKNLMLFLHQIHSVPSQTVWYSIPCGSKSPSHGNGPLSRYLILQTMIWWEWEGTAIVPN